MTHGWEALIHRGAGDGVPGIFAVQVDALIIQQEYPVPPPAEQGPAVQLRVGDVPGVPVQEIDGAGGAEDLHILRPEDDPAAGGDDRPLHGRGPAGGGGLLPAEGGLPVLGKNVRDGAPRLFHHHGVRLHQGHPQPLRQGRPHAGLPAARHADEHHIGLSDRASAAAVDQLLLPAAFWIRSSTSARSTAPCGARIWAGSSKSISFYIIPYKTKKSNIITKKSA